LSVRWDGEVAICCDDWRGEFRCGNIKDGLLDVWHSAAFESARRKLIHGERDFGPCNGCTAKSYRTGLLPDKYGQDLLELPDKESALELEKALAAGPLTKPVLRPWEKSNESNSLGQ
jgi:radical SAM protein with 4Fe4S-binding SPASM domain